MSKQVKTIARSEVATLAMVAGNEDKHGFIISGARLLEWVGIGWVGIREATEEDREKYPVLEHDTK